LIKMDQVNKCMIKYSFNVFGAVDLNTKLENVHCRKLILILLTGSLKLNGNLQETLST
jgi:hypothetical protein